MQPVLHITGSQITAAISPPRSAKARATASASFQGTVIDSRAAPGGNPCVQAGASAGSRPGTALSSQPW